MHASGQAGARPHQGKASDRTQLCLLCAQRSLRLCPDLRGRMLGVNTSPNFFLFWMYTFKSIILASSVFLFVAEYFSCVGKVADAFQHSAVKREKQAVWISLPSGPQVGPIWSRSFIYSTTECCVGGVFNGCGFVVFVKGSVWSPPQFHLMNGLMTSPNGQWVFVIKIPAIMWAWAKSWYADDGKFLCGPQKVTSWPFLGPHLDQILF